MNLYDAHETIDRLRRENAILAAERDAARRVVESLAERVYRQSELLTRKAGRATAADQYTGCPAIGADEQEGD
jgi:hypothetical protein